MVGAGHHHGHAHGPADPRNARRLAIALALAAVYMFAELIGGLLANSLALLADAGHMLSDVGALSLSLFALWIARKPATPQRTYGYHRTEILAALANGATLIAISLLIFVEAYQRLVSPQVVAGKTVMWIAVGGLAVNLAGMAILRPAKDQSLNIRGAWLHLMTDALGSVGAIFGGLLIWKWGWYWADPAVSLAIGLLVIYSSIDLLRESVAVLLEGAPAHVDVREVQAAIQAVAGVEEVHDLHVWTISSGRHAMSGHVVIEEPARPHGEILAEIHRLLHDRFELDHLTIQLEPRNFSEHRCAQIIGC